MISSPEKKVLEESVDLMWDCYQRIAQTPDDNFWTQIFIKAKDIHQALLYIDNEEQDEK